jgi:hypothetical protein
MKKKKELFSTCDNCLGKYKKGSKLNPYRGYKVRKGHLFCKMCSGEIK